MLEFFCNILWKNSNELFGQAYGLSLWLSWERIQEPLEKGKATHSSVLAWRIPWTVESMGSQRVGYNWATFTSLHTCSSESLPQTHMQYIQVPLGNSNCWCLLLQACHTHTESIIFPSPPVAFLVNGRTIYIMSGGTQSTYALLFLAFPLCNRSPILKTLTSQYLSYLIPSPHSHTTLAQVLLTSCLD